MSIAIKDIEQHLVVKKVLDSNYVSDFGDGRKRLIAALAQLLKHKYSDKKELIDFLWSWYKYSNGKDLTYGQVAYQVNYAYSKPMGNPFGFLMYIARDLGIEVDEKQETESNLQDEPRNTN